MFMSFSFDVSGAVSWDVSLLKYLNNSSVVKLVSMPLCLSLSFLKNSFGSFPLNDQKLSFLVFQ